MVVMACLRQQVSALVSKLLASETEDDDDELELEQRFWEIAVSSFKKITGVSGCTVVLKTATFFKVPPAEEVFKGSRAPERPRH